ncbi:MAG: D-glycero-beta-D-manno-heptose 1-phosphate adenylyltransferase [candidate division Zixibacteria bacterium]
MKSKIVSQKEAARIREKLRRQKKKVVFTNGCFDLIHAGHALYLDKAKGKGDFLIVGLNRDNSVRRLKGKNRPVMCFKERALLLSYLTPVNLVVGFGNDTPLNLIELLKPDILAKGADYKISEIVGAKIVRQNGGKVVRIPLVRGKSTSSVLKRLNQ